MSCPNCGAGLNPMEGPYTSCHRCGKPFSFQDMIGETGVINKAYEEAKLDWRREIAIQAKSSGLPHWTCKVCKRVYDTPEPRHRVCQECRTGKPQSSV